MNAELPRSVLSRSSRPRRGASEAPLGGAIPAVRALIERGRGSEAGRFGDFRRLRALHATDVGAAIVDYVFGDHFRGAWLGTGFEFWHSSMGHADHPGQRVQWNSGVFTVGGGYIFPIAGNFYIEPWAAGHLVVNDPNPRLGEAEYRPMRLSGEVSLKVGVFFDL